MRRYPKPALLDDGGWSSGKHIRLRRMVRSGTVNQARDGGRTIMQVSRSILPSTDIYIRRGKGPCTLLQTRVILIVVLPKDGVDIQTRSDLDLPTRCSLVFAAVILCIERNHLLIRPTE